MRFLRWVTLALLIAGGFAGLGGRGAVAAPVPSAGLAVPGELARPLAEKSYYGYYRRHYRRRFYRGPRYYRRRHFYRPYYYRRPFYGRSYYRRRIYYRRPYYRRFYY